MSGTKAFQKIRPSKIGLALAQSLVIMGKLVKWKRSGMKDAQEAFDENITENRIITVSIKVGPKILQQFLLQGMARFMFASKKMVVIFVKTTSCAIRTSQGMSMVHNMANRQKTMSPLQKKVGRR